MSRYNDPDSPDYQEHNLGDMRETPEEREIERLENRVSRLRGEKARLRKALQGLFDNCAMVHKHWGDGSNQREADAALEFAREALERSK